MRKKLVIGILGLLGAIVTLTVATSFRANAREIRQSYDDTVLVFEETSGTIDLPYEPKPEEAPLNPTVTDHHEDIDGRTWEYFLYEARPGGSNQPLVLSLHGSGECGSGLDALRYGGSLAKYILDGSLEPDCIVLMPQCPSFGWDTTALKSLLDHVVLETEADPSRLSVTGVSMGGFGTWALLSEYPNLFRRAAPIASNATDLSGLANCTAEVLALSGTADGYDAQSGVDAVNAGRGTARHVWIDGAGHGDMCNIYANEEHNPLPFLLEEDQE